MKYGIKLFLVCLALILVNLFLGSHKALAITPNDLPSNFSSSITDYNNRCSSIPEKYAYYIWVAKQGNPTKNVTIRVPSGTQTVGLELNELVFICKDHVTEDARTYPGLPPNGTPSAVALRNVYTYINGVSASSGSIDSSPAGSTGTISYDSGNRYWFANSLNFTYNNGTPLTATKTITVHADTTVINKYSSGSYYCVGGGGLTTKRPPTYPDYGCRSSGADFTIEIIVDPPPIVSVPISAHVYKVYSDGTLAGDVAGATIETCNGLVATNGTGFANFSLPKNTAFCIRVAGGAPGGAAGPFVRPWNVGYRGCGGFSGPPYSGYCDGVPAYEGQAAGIDSLNGYDRNVDDGYDIVYVVDRPAEGYVDGARCGRIWGWAADRDVPTQSLKVHVYIDAPYGSPGSRFVGQWSTDRSDYTAPDPSPAASGEFINSANNIDNFINTPGAQRPTSHIFDIASTDSLEITGFTLASFADYNVHRIYVYAIGVDSNGNPQLRNTSGNTSGTSLGTACAPPSCGTTTTTPPEPEPGTNIDFKTNIVYSPGSNGLPITSVNAQITAPDGTVVYPSQSQGLDPTNSFVITLGSPKTDKPGEYVVNVSGVAFAGGVPACNTSSRLGFKPYVKAFGGDVRVGGSFANASAACSGSPASGQGKILTFANTDGSGNFNGGSSTQYAAQAFDLIDLFASKSGSSGSFNALSFANTPTPPGNFGKPICAHNYMADKDKPGVTPIGGIINLSLLAAGSYKIAGNSIITQNPGDLTTRLSLYIEGTASINSNINLKPDGFDIDFLNIPSLTIVAQNVVVDPGVNNIDATLVAQPIDSSDTTNGKFVSCTGVAPLNLINTCNTQLVINGQVLARIAYFNRSYGSLVDSLGNLTESPGSGARTCKNSSTSRPVCASEVVDTIIESSLRGSSGNDYKIKSIEKLPPIL